MQSPKFNEIMQSPTNLNENENQRVGETNVYFIIFVVIINIIICIFAEYANQIG